MMPKKEKKQVVATENTVVPWYKRLSFCYIPLMFAVLSVLLDVVMYAFMHLPFPPSYLYSLLLIFGVAGLTCLTQRKWLQISILSVLFGLQIFTCGANILCYSNLSEVFCLESVVSVRNAVRASRSGALHLEFVLPIVCLVILYVIGCVVISRQCRVKVIKRDWVRLVSCLAVVVLIGSTNFIYHATFDKYNDTYVQNLNNGRFNYDTFLNRIENLKMFGSYSFYFNNLLYVLSVKKPVTEILDITVQEELVPDSLGYTDLAEQQLKKGDNLIMILMETFEKDAINPITMPNLYAFMHNSCTMIDGYRSLERTCMTDYIGQTGTHVLGREMWSAYGDVEIPFSLANIFNRADYVTRAFHNYRGDFYDRDKIFTGALGFQEFRDYSYLSEQQDQFACNHDEILFKENLSSIAPADQDFYSYLISISTHGISMSVDLREYYEEEFAFIEEPENFERLCLLYPTLLLPDPHKVQGTMNYLAGTISFDRGFGALLRYLRTTDDETAAVPGTKLIETTAIVMFGDHYYYMSPNTLSVQEERVTGNKCPFIVYNPHAPAANYEKSLILSGFNAAEDDETDFDLPATGREIVRFSATMDIYKTVCSLFGIVTDQQLTYGHSVLVDDEVYPANRTVGIGYLNGAIWGDDWRTTDFIQFSGRKLTGEELQTMIDIADQSFSAIIANMTLFRTNGFKKLVKCYYQLPAA